MATKIDRGAPNCTDQIPVLSHFGRGIAGDSFRVDLATDDGNRTILKGMSHDSSSNSWTQKWATKNINGGVLDCSINHDSPYQGMFTMTFSYVREDYPNDSWTIRTPGIPYFDAYNFVTNSELDTILGMDSQSIVSGLSDNVREFIEKSISSLSASLNASMSEFMREVDGRVNALGSSVDEKISSVNEDMELLSGMVSESVKYVEEEVKADLENEVKQVSDKLDRTIIDFQQMSGMYRPMTEEEIQQLFE